VLWDLIQLYRVIINTQIHKVGIWYGVLNAVSRRVPNTGPLVNACSITGGTDGLFCAPYDYTD
jgi:hypothetical protein